jgi:hypothetical protein
VQQGDSSEEAARTKTRKTEIVPSVREVQECNIDHDVFRSWCLHCVKGRAEASGRKKEKERSIAVIGIDYMYMHSEQEKDEEKMLPIIVMKDSRTKMIVSNVVTSKGVFD